LARSVQAEVLAEHVREQLAGRPLPIQLCPGVYVVGIDRVAEARAPCYNEVVGPFDTATRR